MSAAFEIQWQRKLNSWATTLFIKKMVFSIHQSGYYGFVLIKARLISDDKEKSVIHTRPFFKIYSAIYKLDSAVKDWEFKPQWNHKSKYILFMTRRGIRWGANHPNCTSTTDTLHITVRDALYFQDASTWIPTYSTRYWSPTQYCIQRRRASELTKRRRDISISTIFQNALQYLKYMYGTCFTRI